MILLVILCVTTTVRTKHSSCVSFYNKLYCTHLKTTLQEFSSLKEAYLEYTEFLNVKCQHTGYVPLITERPLSSSRSFTHQGSHIRFFFTCQHTIKYLYPETTSLYWFKKEKSLLTTLLYKVTEHGYKWDILMVSLKTTKKRKSHME